MLVRLIINHSVRLITFIVFRTKNGKLKALLKNVLSTHESKGRPILIGTTSIESSEELYAALKDLDIPANILNARPENVERESDIVAQAGRIGAVTVATNMAGRGTDIILGGSSKGMIKSIMKTLLLIRFGLFQLPESSTTTEVIGDDTSDGDVVTESDDDNSSDFLVAVRSKASSSSNQGELDEEDEEVEEESDPDVLALPSVQNITHYLSIDLPKNLKKSTELNLKRAVVSVGDALESSSVDKIIIEDVITKATESIPLTDPTFKFLRQAMTNAITEVEALLKEEKERVKKMGGLYVIGTSRHESRRIDQQLRGRAGRQGDPGSSRFFLSLEDDIFKIFGADKLAGILDNFRVSEDMPIESELVVQALDKVQTQVEDYYRAIRRQVYRLDEIAASQRAVVYSQRRAFLTSTDEGMIDIFIKYCQQTMMEIYEASLLPVANSRGKPAPGGPVNADKLVSKALQFFPNLHLTKEEISTSELSVLPGLLQSKLLIAIAAKRQEIDTASVNELAFLSFFRYLSVVQVGS